MKKHVSKQTKSYEFGLTWTDLFVFGALHDLYTPSSNFCNKSPFKWTTKQKLTAINFPYDVFLAFKNKHVYDILWSTNCFFFSSLRMIQFNHLGTPLVAGLAIELLHWLRSLSAEERHGFFDGSTQPSAVKIIGTFSCLVHVCNITH